MTSAHVDDILDFDEVIAKYDPVMGLEVHVELSTETKMFCNSPTAFGAEPNTHVSPTCMGLPGALPVVNQQAVDWAIKIGLALNCQIASYSRFARKNYFYPDQPKNYQISHMTSPLPTTVIWSSSSKTAPPSGLILNVLTWRKTPAN